jgi:hypothetical protein
MANSTLSPSVADLQDCLIGWAKETRSTGTKFALLFADLDGVSSTWDGMTTQITVAAQFWPTGRVARIKNVNPLLAPSIAPLNTTTDYFLIRDTATIYRLASSYANAIAGIALPVPTIAVGNYNLYVEPAPDWTMAEVVEAEINHPLYSRFEIPATLPAPTVAGSVVTLDIEIATITNTSGSVFRYNAIALIKGGGAVGTTTGTLTNLGALKTGGVAYTVAISPGGLPRKITYNRTAKAA